MSTETFTIAAHGDDVEKKYWTPFCRGEWPAYELFWQRRVVPVTYRTSDPTSMKTRSTADLPEGFTEYDIAIAQLHYTALRHVGRAWEISSAGGVDHDGLSEGMTRLAGALDVADELLQRVTQPGTYVASATPTLANATGS